MGGVNAAVTVAQGSDEDIRTAVDQALEVLSLGNGFILFPVDNLFCSLPWEKVVLIIDQYIN